MASRREFLKVAGMTPAVFLAAQLTREASSAPIEKMGLPRT